MNGLQKMFDRQRSAVAKKQGTKRASGSQKTFQLPDPFISSTRLAELTLFQ